MNRDTYLQRHAALLALGEALLLCQAAGITVTSLSDGGNSAPALWTDKKGGVSGAVCLWDGNDHDESDLTALGVMQAMGELAERELT